MENLRVVLRMKKNDKMRNYLVREICGMKEDINKRISKSFLKMI